MTPSSAFSEIWEKEFPWPEGPGILSTTVHFLQNTPVEVGPHPQNRYEARVNLNLEPLVKLSFGWTPFQYAVPERLRSIYSERLYDAATTYLESIKPTLEVSLGRKMTPTFFELVNHLIRCKDQDLEREGAALWQLAADNFGLNWGSLPQPTLKLDDRGIFNWVPSSLFPGEEVIVEDKEPS